jgi:geranylgeranylglycerol-phosphate geranylgeranyltransferase
MGSVLTLVRARNLLLSAAGVAIGGVLAQGRPVIPGMLWWAMVSAMCLGAAGNVANDIADRDADAVNRPDRPLVKGSISVNVALALGGIAGGVGLLIPWFISLRLFALALAALVVMLCYSPLLKQFGLGNFAVAVVASLPPIYGATAVGWWRAGLVASVLAAILHFAREIVKDLEDVAGDQAQGRRTIPLVWGRETAFVLAAAALIAFVPLSLAPWFAHWYGTRYALVVMVLDVMMLALIARLLARQLDGARALLKGAMLAGLAALLWDRL